jgi:hypothetical protein
MDEQRLEEALDAVKVQAEQLPSKEDLDRSEARSTARLRIMFAGMCLVALALGVIAVFVSFSNIHDISANAAQDALRDSSLKSLQDANGKLIAKGLPPIPEPPAGQTVDQNSLAQAAAALVLADPRFAGLTIADLRRQVEGYFASHPLPEGQKPTTDQVTTAVAAIYAANPPKNGRPPTADEIFQAVSAYCGGDTCRGPRGDQGDTGENGINGTNGKDADPVTPEQIMATVNMYCGQSSKPCASNEPGPSGPKPVSADFEFAPPEAQADACYYVTTYDNEKRILAPVPPALCGG